MTLYRTAKDEIGRNKLRGNSKGSALLFEAKSGCLRMWSYRRKFLDRNLCIACENSSETIEHILVECHNIHPVINVGVVRLPEALRFKDSSGNVNLWNQLEDW